jgi:hypothetical protein
MSPGDLATLSLLDTDQGVCPAGHPCRLNKSAIGWRRCAASEYLGMALICWDVTRQAIDDAETRGANVGVVTWARTFLRDQTDVADRG